MRSTIFAAAVLAVGAMAVPAAQLNKRNVVVKVHTEVQVVTKQVTVTAGVAAASPAPESRNHHSRNHHSRNHHRHHHYQQSVSQYEAAAQPETSSTTQTMEPTQTKEPKQKSTQKPTKTKEPASTSKAKAKQTVAASDTSNDVYTGPDDASKLAVELHNESRLKHHVDPLSWDDDLASIAASDAARCSWEHHTDGYGQNYAMTTEMNADEQDSIENAITSWVEEESDFAAAGGYGSADAPNTSEMTGHFTQVVWKGTSKIGCATITCNSGMPLGGSGTFTVCNYKEAGNMMGAYAENVLSP